MRAASAVLGCLALAACAEDVPKPGRVVAGGDAERGRAIVASGRHGCIACHSIPGVRAARGIVGPSLAGFGDRSFIAGQLPNAPGVLIRFLENPTALIENSGMPNVGLSAEEARHVAAFLYEE